MKLSICVLFIWLNTAFSDIKSTTGQVEFDLLPDHLKEMTLNNEGLGLFGLPTSKLHVHGNGLVTETLNIGNSAGSSTLNIHGTIGFNTKTLNTTTILEDSSIYFADTSSDNLSLSLPYAGNTMGRIYTIKKTYTNNNVWITGGGNLIDNVLSVELPATETALPYLKLISDGEQWYVLEGSDFNTSISNDNLLLYLNFDDTIITDQSDSSVGNNATFSLSGTASVNINDGLSGGALNLINDGSKDYLRIGNISTIYTNFTCSAFVNLNTHTDDGTILSRRDGSGTGRSWLRLNHSNQSFNTFIGGADADGSVISPVYGVWHHFAVTYQEGIIKIYTNGMLDQTVNFNEESATGDFLIGIHKGLSIQPLKGLVDEFKLFNYALSPDEVSVLAQNTK